MLLRPHLLPSILLALVPVGCVASTTGPSGGVVGPPAAVSGKTLVIEDFEDGDNRSLLNGGWYDYTDASNGGGSTLTVSRDPAGKLTMTGPGFKSKASLEVSYAFKQATLPYKPFVGMGVWLADKSSPFSLRAYSAIAYAYKGGAHRVRVETAEIGDYDFFGMELPASTEWVTAVIPFKHVAQEGWGKKAAFDPSHLTSISFQMKGNTGDKGTLWIDDLTAREKIATTDANLTIHDPNPPADEVLASIAISNPLQKRAMESLNRGYNITNWLEEKRFAGFVYDEAFIAKLAKAGFKSLRLPIDMDRYIAGRTGTGDTLSLTLHSDFFLVLDSFASWTKKHGMSLTIDYHQYDHSLDVLNPASVADVEKLWAKVAEHFASDPRTDLFYELMNEPELSAVESHRPTQPEWAAVAEKLVAAIRAKDTIHTIIFGDVEWNGITPLTHRLPLADPNVIYTFHFYEPFIFTHQGASWVNMSATRDIPYPYAKARWADHYEDLGYTAHQESWIMNLVRSYHQGGNRSAMRNRILEAKRWAVTNNVPVICNEFGALDRTSRVEDRLRYYTDLIGIFDELAIPWQHWFMVMDESGAMIPELRAAFRLKP